MMKFEDITTEQINQYLNNIKDIVPVTSNFENKVCLLTELQKDELIGIYYTSNSLYNPIQDLNDNWIISVEEIANTINPATQWVKDLELIPYEPKPTPSPF